MGEGKSRLEAQVLAVLDMGQGVAQPLEKMQVHLAAARPGERPVETETVLRQVIAREKDGSLSRFRDLPGALEGLPESKAEEWRAHFHVPIFAEKFDLLSSTQDEITEVLLLQKKKPFAQHLEVETYTWEVLPADLRLPLQDSIIRELEWVKRILED